MSSEDARRNTDSTTSRWLEEQPGPSRQGYCGYCSLIYTNLDQHVSSARHRDRVRLSSRSSSLSSLMERFLQDVLVHHPNHYTDTHLSHGDLPSSGSPLVARADVAELCISNNDVRSQGTRDLYRSNHTSTQLIHPEEVDVQTTATHSQSERLLFEEAGLDRSSQSITEHDTRESPKHTTFLHSPGEDLPPQPLGTPSPVHRKCHRKTDRRRKPSSSSSSFHAPVFCSTPLPDASSMLGCTPLPPDRVSGCNSSGHPQGETESFNFSLPASQRTGESDDWDTPVQVFENGKLCPQIKTPPVQLGQSEAWKLTCLTESQVELDDQVYTRQLNSALRTLPGDSGWSHHLDSTRRTLPADSGPSQQTDPSLGTLLPSYRCLPIEEVRPCPPYIPESFRGKTLAQIEREDEEKVESLVQQFRHHTFLCYFDTESLARYGRRSLANRRHEQNQEAENAAQLFPLLDHHDDIDDPECTRKMKTKEFRLASRCQVVKLSRGTQTTPLIVPAVRQPAQPHPPLPLEEQPANQQPAESPEAEGRIPNSYSRLLTPLQPSTSLLLLLCSPSPAHAQLATPTSHAAKRCRKRSRPLKAEGSKVRYKRLPVRWYDPAARRVLESRPRRLQPHGNNVARQLFRSLSPDLNAHGRGGRAGGRGGGRKRRRRREEDNRAEVKVQRSSSEETPHIDRLPLGMLRTDPREQGARGRGRRKWGRRQTSGRGRGRRGESREVTSCPRPRKRGGRRARDRRKVPGSEGPLEASARSLRIRRKTGCLCCNE